MPETQRLNFPCTGCGACCRHLPPGAAMARADGSCRHLDAETQRCDVYAQRPLICRIDEMYRTRIAGRTSARVFYLLQANACASLDARNAELPRLVAEQLMTSPAVEQPSRATAVDAHPGSFEQQRLAFMTLDPQERDAGIRHIMGEARWLIRQTIEG